MMQILRFILSIKKFMFKIYYRISWLFYKRLYPNSTFGKNILLNGLPLLKLYGKVCFGDNLTFNSSTMYNTVGLFKQCSIFVDSNATLIIGENSGFSGVSIHCEKQITIGSYCNFGGNVCIWDTDFHSLDYMHRRKLITSDIKSLKIEIGNDVFIGANSIILKGVTIGDRSIIGAGSIVTSTIPSDEIWAGNPARFIKKINRNYD